MPEAGDDEAGEITEQAGSGAGDQEPAQRLAPAPLREQAGSIGTEAEIGGVAERDDARIAEDEVERQREQRGDGDLARPHEIVGRENERGERREPERDLDRPPADPRLEITLWLGPRPPWHPPHAPQ